MFGILQTGQLETCDTKRRLAVASADLHNLYVDRLVEDLRHKGFLMRLFGRRDTPVKPTLDALSPSP